MGERLGDWDFWRAASSGWLILGLAVLLAVTGMATVTHWYAAADRFGPWVGFGHALEYAFLPASALALRILPWVLLAGLFLQAFGRALGGSGLAALVVGAGIVPALFVSLVFLVTLTDTNDLYYGALELRGWPDPWLTVALALTAVVGGTGLRLYFVRAWHRRLLCPLSVVPVAIFVLLATMALWGIGDEPGGRNVILISMDTLRADHVGAYGYPRPTTPNIDRLARQGAVYENAITQAPWTLPAHMTLFTGLYPSEHGLTRFSLDPHDWRRLGDDVPLLAELLARQGVVTAAFTGGGFLSPVFGFSRGFDQYRTDGRRLERFHAKILRWLDRNRRWPFFLFVHFYNCHRPYRPPPPWNTLFVPSGVQVDAREVRGFCRRAEEARTVPDAATIAAVTSQYDGEIGHADELVGELLDRLDALDLASRTLVVFLSDHGEELFEHGNCDHIKSLYDPLIRIPLIVRGPGVEADSRVRETVELPDVAQMILDSFDIEARLGGHARQLLGPDPIEDRPGYSETDHKGYEIVAGEWRYQPWERGIRAVRGRTAKLITSELGEPLEFYDLENDPFERVNLPDRNRVGSLAGRLREVVDLAPRRDREAAIGEETLDQLRALGYIE